MTAPTLATRLCLLAGAAVLAVAASGGTASATTYTFRGGIDFTRYFTAPTTGTYDVVLFGAAGGNGGACCNGTGTTGGLGAEVGGDFSLTAGEELFIRVGSPGLGISHYGPGSAGGGGGGGYFGNGSPGQAGPSGTAGAGGAAGRGGTNGNGGLGGSAGGQDGGGGGGFFTAGGNGQGGTSNGGGGGGGAAVILVGPGQEGAGGAPGSEAFNPVYAGAGGYGGGGGAGGGAGGGGGGYSGGGGGSIGPVAQGGGGGGSYLAPSVPKNADYVDLAGGMFTPPAGLNGYGEVLITFVPALTASAPPSSVPEPASLALLGTALAGLGVVTARRRRR